LARPTEGYKLRWKRGVAYVRFTHEGERFSISTGDRDPSTASKHAAQIYARVISGRRAAPRALVVDGELDELVGDWLVDFDASHEKRTAREYLIVARAHWLTRWKRLNELTSAAISDYTRDALRRVQRVTVRKELSALRGFLVWCVERKLLLELPEIAPPPRAATGVRATTRKREPVPLSPADVERIVAELPTSSRGKPVRDFVVVLWETGLRPATVARLSSPEHYKPRANVLRVAREDDKGRFDRVLDLSPRAAAALTRRAREPGLLFGKVDCRVSLRIAAEAALGKRGKAVTVYDLRHARITSWLAASPNLPGVQYLAGHKNAATTSRYVHPSREAAREVIAASTPRRVARR
jgi:integrase